MVINVFTEADHPKMVNYLSGYYDKHMGTKIVSNLKVETKCNRTNWSHVLLQHFTNFY